MRSRLLFAGIAGAVALSVAPAAQAAPRLYCAEGFEAVCYVIGLTCQITKDDPCHP